MLQARDDGGTDKERGGMKKPLEYRFGMIFKTNKQTKLDGYGKVKSHGLPGG